MRESRIYLNFFKSNIPVIVLPSVITTAFGLYYYSTIPSTFVLSRLYEFSYNEQTLLQQIALSDTAVTLTRSLNIQSQLNMDPQVNLQVTKIAPVVIKTDIESSNAQLLEPNLQRVDNYLTGKYSLKKVGEDINMQHKPNIIFYILGSIAAGFSLGIFISLIKEYFKNY